MHEMGIARQVVNAVLTAAGPHLEETRVVRINLRIGRLSGVVADSLLFHLEILSRDTVLEGAEVHIEDMPVVARCNACGHKWPAEGAVFTCPKCESGDLQVISGREFDVVSIDVAD